MVSPGVIDTQGLREMHRQRGGAQSWEDFERNYAPNPMGRLGSAHDIAAAITFLCGESASYITGINLPVDGGITIRP